MVLFDDDVFTMVPSNKDRRRDVLSGVVSGEEVTARPDLEQMPASVS
jgi:hypothetical protein